MNKYSKVAVVIDVFRAFTTACHILESQPSEYYMVSSSTVAQRLKSDRPRALLVGKPEIGANCHYDIPNSPTLVSNLAIKSRPVIHRTNSGAAGAIYHARSGPTIAVCFANLDASARWLKHNTYDFDIYPMGLDGHVPTLEDNLCKKSLLALFNGKLINPIHYYEELKNSTGRYFFESNQCEYPSSDFNHCLNLNSHNFSLIVSGFADYVQITCG